MRGVSKNLPNTEITSASILDRWKNKKIKVTTEGKKVETNWKIFAAEIIGEKPVIYIRKKVPAGDPTAITRGIDYEEFLSWQGQE